MTQLAFHRAIKCLKLVRQFVRFTERPIDRIRDPIRIPTNILQLFLADGDFDEREIWERKGVDAFDQPGRLVVEGYDDLAFESAEDGGGDVSSGEDGVDDKNGNVNGGVDIGRRGCVCRCYRGRRCGWGWCGRSLGKERHK